MIIISIVFPILVYSLFMYIGLMLSDYGFATDKWYWQTLTYILSILISIFDLFIAICLPLLYIFDPFNAEEAGYRKTWRDDKPIGCFLFALLLITNAAFSVYTLYFNIRYILEFKKIRDIVLAGIGGAIVLI